MILYTDDKLIILLFNGNIQFTTNGGKSWDNVRENVAEVPEGLWVSRLEASHFQDGRAYLSFDGHRSDNFQPWVFMTDDYGNTWNGYALFILHLSFYVKLSKTQLVAEQKESEKNSELAKFHFNLDQI